jgi:hypothetical protein
MSKSVMIQNVPYEMERVGVDAYYGYAESDCLESLALVLEEVEEQGCETNMTEGKEKKYRLEFSL